MVSDERMQILQMIEEKRITPQEGVKLLEALSPPEGEAFEGLPADEAAVGAPGPERAWPEETAPASDSPSELAKVSHLWLIPLAVGGLLSAVGLALVALIGPGSLFLVCGLTPLLLGLATILLALWSRTARWLHVRISGEQRISLSFPVPLRLAAWVLRLLRSYVPQLEETALDEVILSLDESLTGEEGFYVDVQDDEAGERVQVYLR